MFEMCRHQVIYFGFLISSLSFLHFLQNLPSLYLFDPSGKKKTVWDILSVLAIIYSLIDVPFRIGFLPLLSLASTPMDYTIEAIFLIDIFITFNVPLINVESNTLITDRLSIARAYLTFWFWLDFLSAFPFDSLAYLFDNNSGNHGGLLASFKLIRILRLTRLAKLLLLTKSTDFRDFLDNLRISPSILNIFSLLFKIFLLAHIIACFWFFISTSTVTGVVQPTDSSLPFGIRTWVTQFGFQYSDVSTQYIASLYWTFTTLLSVGYGDIHPVNSGERLYAITIMLIGSLMFGAIIAIVKGKKKWIL